MKAMKRALLMVCRSWWKYYNLVIPSLSSSLFFGLVRETGNEVGKDLDIRHFEVEREKLAGDWVEMDVKCIVGPPLGKKFAVMFKMGPLKQSHNAPSRPGLPRNLKMRNCNARKL